MVVLGDAALLTAVRPHREDLEVAVPVGPVHDPASVRRPVAGEVVDAFVVGQEREPLAVGEGLRHLPVGAVVIAEHDRAAIGGPARQPFRAG